MVWFVCIGKHFFPFVFVFLFSEAYFFPSRYLRLIGISLPDNANKKGKKRGKDKDQYALIYANVNYFRPQSMSSTKNLVPHNFSQLFVITVTWQNVIGKEKNGGSMCK